MPVDLFSVLLEGSRIVNRQTEARLCARALCRWLADAMNASTVRIRFTDENRIYCWEERVDRIVAGATTASWSRPFPQGRSIWLFDGGQAVAELFAPILDLIAEQWLSKNWTFTLGRGGLRRPSETSPPNPAWVAISRPSRIVYSRLPHLSQSRKPLLLIGETGSGKSYIARLIHRNGPEPSAPFGEPGDDGKRGTVFISDWYRMAERDQRMIIRDARRVIAAVTPDEEDDAIRRAWMRRTGGNGLMMRVPALRHRIEDLPLLAGQFLTAASADLGRRTPEISPKALEALRCYAWPGNARELKETMFRSLKSTVGEVRRLDIGDLPPAVRGAVIGSSERSFPECLAALEYETLEEELRRQRGNMTRTARDLGLTPRQVSWRLKKYGIDPRKFKPGYGQAVD